MIRVFVDSFVKMSACVTAVRWDIKSMHELRDFSWLFEVQSYFNRLVVFPF